MANTRRKKFPKKKNQGFSVPRWDKGSRVLSFVGLALVLIAFFSILSFGSYFFTREADFSWVMSLGDSVLDENLDAANWMGRLGARVSHWLVYSSFGIAAFCLSAVLLIIAGGLIYENKLSWKKLRSIHLLLWLTFLLSISIGYLVGLINPESEFDFLGGQIGVYISEWLNGFIGKVGTGLLLLFSWLGFGVLGFDFSLGNSPTLANPFTKIFNYFKSDPEKKVEQRKSREGKKKAAKEKIEAERKALAIEESERKTILFEKSDLKNKDEPKNLAGEEPRQEIALEIEKKNETKKESSVELEVKTESSSLEDSLEPAINESGVKKEDLFDPTLELSKYKFPPTSLLDDHGTGAVQIDDEELERNKEQIIETLGHYKIDIDKIYATVGPTVKLYEIVPAPGVRISKIKNLEDDIALSLAALGIRIIAPMPGKGTIGIEVPNKSKQTVSALNLLKSEKFKNSKFDLPVAIGRTISNEIFIADLARMPHLLVAGATGQGKSVGINVILASLLYKKHPSQIKFVLVDPKKVELSIYRKIEKHFLAKLPDADEAIITDTDKVVSTLKSLCLEMDSRYNLLKEGRARNINEYNKKFIQRKLNPEKGHHFLPFIVLVIDEFADLMLTAGKEIESPIARLAQLARAVGIHLIVATQRPSVNIITGTIKANFPARIAFRVTAKVDSRTILDQGGADRLIGRGDMLMQIGSELIRLQCAFIDTPEVERITDFIGDQQGYSDAFLLPEVVDESGSNGPAVDLDDRDDLFDEAARIIVRHQQGSTSLLQRRLKIGYNRAGRLIDQLQLAGIVGPFEGSKAREVYISDEYQLEQFLSDIDK